MACVLHSRPRGIDGNMEGMWESRDCIAVQAANVVCMGSQGQEWFACSDKDCMLRRGGKSGLQAIQDSSGLAFRFCR